ncbi:MAG: pallilysin-related adhesin [Treponema sp.]|jgi:predicted DNA-binding protein (UPF0251 family)|nr:pallilysin-related adhesin [Treponema sp.]
MKKTYIGFFAGTTAVSVLLIVFLATGLWRRFYNPNTNDNYTETRIVTPLEANPFSISSYSGGTTWDESLRTRIPMEDGETVIAVMNSEREEGLAVEQFAAYINAADTERIVYITYINYDERGGRYRRVWDAPTAATRAETLSLFSQDLIGDRNNCVIVTGMNNRNEHTMTIFRRSLSRPENQAYKKIAELQIDGSIVINETGRSNAYQQGITNGQSFTIAAYGHDSASNNILDQIETVYSFNPSNEQYELTNVTRIPGSQIEQRRLRELLSGAPGVFEEFLNDLWYYVSPQGTIDSRQYLFFDPYGREILFYGEEAQQVFQWQNSTPTRYGLYIRSQNISISTLLRFIDIELESLESIRLRVNEDVQLRIAVSTSWDGTYRRVGTAAFREPASIIRPAVDAVYDSSLGRLRFQNTGEYTITSGGIVRGGRYVFYTVEEQELLELRPNGSEGENRMIYKVDKSGDSSLILSRVRLGTSGIQDMLEPQVMLIVSE